jgi:two-component system, NarL family, invasion response regulator UvrY
LEKCRVYSGAQCVPKFTVGWDVRLECENVMISALVIDDHPIVLQGCRRLLEDAGVTSVLEAGDVAAGYELFCCHRPDIVIVDLAMGENGVQGLSLIQRIKAHDPRARILVLSMHRDPIIVARALEAGASGYILKDTATEDLLNAIQTIQDGNSYLNQDLALEVALARASSRQNPLAELTPRELEMLNLLAEGKSYDGIAEQLNVSYKAVVDIGSRLKRKLDARTLPALVQKAVQLLAIAQ